LGIDSDLRRGPELPSWVSLLSEWLNSEVSGQSQVLRVHVSKESGSVERSKRSVLSKGSPWVEGSVSAGEVQVVLDSSLGNVDGGNSDERRVNLQPLDREIIDGLCARILLKLNLEKEASLSSCDSGGQILSEIISSESSKTESSGSCSSTRVQSVLGSRTGSSSEFVGRDGEERNLENRVHSIVQSDSSISSKDLRIKVCKGCT